MRLSFYSAPIKAELKKKQKIVNDLKKFHKTGLSETSEEQLQQSVELYQQISSSRSQVFIFAFGGIGAGFKIAQSFFSLKNKKALWVDSLDLAFKQKISNLNQKELRSSHFVFISKSGQTSEILFYKKLVDRIYSKNKISLKNKLTILTQDSNSPLRLWGKRNRAHLVFLEDSLPGRFSFFSLSGYFQFLACGLKISPRALAQTSLPSGVFDFLTVLLERQEIWLCFFQPELNKLSHWLEITWSESLFKENMKNQPPILRAVSWPDLRHGFIEELIAKKKQVYFWGLDLKTIKRDPAKDKLKGLLRSKKIPYLFLTAKKDLTDFFDLVRFFYKVLFLAGEFSKVDVKTQPWVDDFKK